ncbi:MAG: diaminopimelate epimerase [Desulfobulbaceae bacterium]|uniref:Diaminopimelate epimerase n=1 Tax=Candidatus Desulfobia pelagia TaxID=2841692 RepID=A0A8J6NDM6_9BACT|nr:diaminopimelate epimerase [Candidatus Desulfobia pelagia]
MSGTGNDFIIIDHRKPFLKREEMSGFARSVCRRRFSVGADGLILIENDDNADFRWQFYNGDGSEAEMCGNGARCAARFAYAKGIAPASMSFLTVAGKISAEVKGESVKLAMTPPENLQLERKVNVGGADMVVNSLNTGVPHAVVFVENNGETPVKEWGYNIRFHEIYQPAGTNVNFVEVAAPNEIHVRTYERGVEDETMACGTGAVASAIIAALAKEVVSPVKVTTSGGEILTIHFKIDQQADTVISDVYLEGPAHFIYEGELQQDALI